MVPSQGNPVSSPGRGSGEPPHPAATWAHKLSRFLVFPRMLCFSAVLSASCHPVALRICLSAPPPPHAQLPPHSPHRSFAASLGDWQSAKRFMKLTKTNLWGNFPGRKSQFPPRFRNRMRVRIATDYLLGHPGGRGKELLGPPWNRWDPLRGP